MYSEPKYFIVAAPYICMHTQHFPCICTKVKKPIIFPANIFNGGFFGWRMTMWGKLTYVTAERRPHQTWLPQQLLLWYCGGVTEPWRSAATPYIYANTNKYATQKNSSQIHLLLEMPLVGNKYTRVSANWQLGATLRRDGLFASQEPNTCTTYLGPALCSKLD